MAECRNFFDESISAAHRSSAFGDKPSFPTPPESIEEGDAHCLELTLGLGPSVGGSQASCPLQVRPASVYTCLPKQNSGNFVPLPPFISPSDLSQTSFPQGDAPTQFENFTGQAEVSVLAKQRSGDFAISRTHTHASCGGQATPLFPPGDSAFPSRDQIWLTLQKNGTISGHDELYASESSSMWGRRSASMHVVIPRKDVGDEENSQIRRSCSSGVFPHTVSREVSSIDCSLTKSPKQNALYCQDHEQEVLEDLRKRKEVQAHRRQEARKRRKNLIEEKQHKKSKQSSSLHHLGSRQSTSPNDKLSLVGASTSEDGGSQELHSKQEGQCKARKGSRMTQNLLAEEEKQETQSQCVKEDKMVSSIEDAQGSSYFLHSKGSMSLHGYNIACRVPMKDGALNVLSHEPNSGSYGSMMTSEFEQSTSVGNCVVGSKHVSTASEHNHSSLHNLHGGLATTVQAGPRMNEDEGGKSSETECVESSNIQNNAKFLQCTSEKGGLGAVVSTALSTAPVASGSLSCSPFSSLAVPYPYTAATPASTAIPMQPGFPFPFLVQNWSHCDNDPSSIHGTCSIVTGTTPGSGAMILKASSANKDCMGESFEGKAGCSEKPAVTPLSSAELHLKHSKEEPQFPGLQLESQVTFPASQLSSISSVVSDACNSKNSLLEGQQSMQLGSRLLSQCSNTQDLSTLSSKQERPILAQRGMDVTHETPTSRMGTKVRVKQAEGFRQEEGNIESGLGSEHSGVDAAAYQQSGTVEGQKSGYFPDLPWVTTTGKGPNGKTINGVMYIVNRQHVRLVCSCHGRHMSPVEFVEHSGSSDLSNPEKNIVVCPFPALNHELASAPV